MRQPAYFDLWLDVYVIAAIAVLGPIGMLLMDRMVRRAVARGWLVRNAAIPKSRVTTGEDLKFMASFVVATGLMSLVAHVIMFRGRNIPIDFGVRPFELVWFTTALMLAVDTNGFFWHRFSHRNTRAFGTFHSGHHRTKGNVHVAVAFYSNTIWDYPLHSGIVLTVGLFLLVLATGHYPAVTIGYATTVYVLAIAVTHSGLRETPAVKWALRVLLFPIAIVPTAIRLEDHERHHAQGDCNYGVFFSHWDRLFGSWQPAIDERTLASGDEPAES